MNNKKGTFMNKKHSINILAIALIFIAQGTLCAQNKMNIILKNNSMWDIEYKKATSDIFWPQSALRKILSGDYVAMDGESNLSIRRYGTLSRETSPWVDVPKVKDLLTKLSIDDAYKFNLATSSGKRVPIINIESSPFGWSFRLSYTE
jgi:hypothetical protein